jgi:hypothetical protein
LADSHDTVATAVCTSTPPLSYSQICAAGLRKGKWTVEEEQYATTLISHFGGNLLPLSEQRESTIRLYLSKKLHCDPMRISKKYAGSKSVGKHFFCKMLEIGPSQTAEALGWAAQEREHMRQSFVESVERDIELALKRRKKQPKVRDRGKRLATNDTGGLSFVPPSQAQKRHRCSTGSEGPETQEGSNSPRDQTPPGFLVEGGALASSQVTPHIKPHPCGMAEQDKHRPIP